MTCISPSLKMFYHTVSLVIFLSLCLSLRAWSCVHLSECLHWGILVGWRMTSLAYLGPNSWNLSTLPFSQKPILQMWLSEGSIGKEIREIILNFLGKPGSQSEEETWWGKQRRGWCTLKMQEGATSQRIKVVARSWKRQGKGSSFRSLQRNHPCCDTDFSPEQLLSDFWLQNFKRTNLWCFKATRFVLICLHYFLVAAITIF